jgi:PAT family beta-lactamase induction signal transducer AmpG
MHKDSENTWLTHLAEDRRYAAMAGLGFSSGLPFLLVYSTQSAWLSEAADRDDRPPQRTHYRL